MYVFIYNILTSFVYLFTVYADNQNVLGELFLTLGSLVVRNEFCQEVLNLGGVHFILQAFGKNINDKVWFLKHNF